MKETKGGPMSYNINDKYAGQSLELYGEYAADQLELLGQLVREGDYIVDAGAHIGAISVPLAKVVGSTGKVHSFEPSKPSYGLLEGNVKLNHLQNVVLSNKAVGARESQLVVPQVNTEVPGCHGCVALDPSNFVGEPTQVLTIDSLNMMRARLLIFDIEGMEVEAIQGAERTIRMFKPALYVRAQFNPADNTLGVKTQQVAKFVKTLEYDMYWHFVRMFSEDNFARNPSNVYGNEQLLYMLCVPHVEGSAVEGLEPVVVPE